MNDEGKYALMKMPVAEIGRALSCGSDEDQAAVLNSMGKEIKIHQRDKELNGLQVCYMAAALDRHGRDLVKSLAEYVSIREEEDA